MTESRSTFVQYLGAAKVESTLLVLFIPSVDRDSQPIDQDTWVYRALETLGELFGGATAFPQAKVSGATMPRAVGWCLTSPS
ncbi:MAG TPA: hypothetical protein VI542_16800 [Candidatus Tectomicrobia bacterium]